MKRTFLLIIGILIFYVFVGDMFSKVEIPNEAIRIRIIANSNSTLDQYVKNEVKNNLEPDMYYLLKNSKTIDESRNIINSNLDRIDENVKSTLHSLNSNINYDINFGFNYFPSKKYKGITYKDGYYESLVVTLGEGKGDNWWCVLFPPLCLLEAEESTDVEYKSYVKELIDKYF